MGALHLKADNLSMSYEGRSIFHSLSFDLKSGDLIHLKGANGSGKTTLLRILSSLVKPTSGTLEFNGHPLGRNLKSYLPFVGFVGSTEQGYFPRLNGAENLDFYRVLSRMSVEDFDKLLTPYKDLKIYNEVMRTPYYRSSRGMKQLLSYFVMTLKQPRLFLLDEFFSSLDSDVESKIWEVLEKDGEDKIIVYVDHNVKSHLPKRTKEFTLYDGQLSR